jgi:hypothetical protein
VEVGGSNWVLVEVTVSVKVGGCLLINYFFKLPQTQELLHPKYLIRRTKKLQMARSKLVEVINCKFYIFKKLNYSKDKLYEQTKYSTPF